MLRAALLATLLCGCAASAPPRATALDAERAHVQLADLDQGRSLLVRKCGGCHGTPLPSAHTRLEWPRSLDEMSGRANLSPGDRRAIEQYLVALAPR
jgi:hypothetical protein